MLPVRKYELATVSGLTTKLAISVKTILLFSNFENVNLKVGSTTSFKKSTSIFVTLAPFSSSICDISE